MTLTDIALIRLGSQQISSSKFTNPKELVGWMGAVQAQDYSMSKWAIGCRLPQSTEKTVEAAIDKGEILRTHVLRPTWHIVSPDDIYWMLQLTASRIKAAMQSHNKELELTPKVFNKSNALIEKLLVGGRHLTREELSKEFEKAKIATHANRLSHLMAWAELDGLVCSGASKNNKTSYALLEERVQKPPGISQDEALWKLASKYFKSHYPATLKDFAWWSGLSATEARWALDGVKKDLVSETVAAETYWMPADCKNDGTGKNSAYLLPAYDEFIISYKDRSASIQFENKRRAISSNGLFRPIVVTNGRVTGLWNRAIKNNGVTIGIESFNPYSAATGKRINKSAESLGRFLNKSPLVKYTE